jgi:hypothetical protein
MTQDQMLMLLRMALQGVGTFLIAKNIFTAADWTLVVGAVLQVAPLGWSFWARRESALKASAGAIPNTVVVTLPPTALPATDTRQTTQLAAKLATLPEVQSVISTPEVAAATVSEKVVSGTAAPATP